MFGDEREIAINGLGRGEQRMNSKRQQKIPGPGVGGLRVYFHFFPQVISHFISYVIAQIIYHFISC